MTRSAKGTDATRSRDATVVSLRERRRAHEAYAAARTLVAEDLADLFVLLHESAFRLARHGAWRRLPRSFVEARAGEGRLGTCGDPRVIALLGLRAHIEEVLDLLAEEPR